LKIHILYKVFDSAQEIAQNHIWRGKRETGDSLRGLGGFQIGP